MYFNFVIQFLKKSIFSYSYTYLFRSLTFIKEEEENLIFDEKFKFYFNLLYLNNSYLIRSILFIRFSCNSLKKLIHFFH